MDEFQFIESLDALLANEAIDETTTAAVEFANTSITPVHGQGILSGPNGPVSNSATNTTWLGGNDTFAMPLHTSQGLMAGPTSTASATPSPATASYPQYTTAYIDPNQQQQQPQTKGLGHILPSTSPPVAIASPIQRTNTAAANVAPSAVASVCSANSRGSSNASSSRRKSGGKSNNSTTSGGSAGSAKAQKAGSRKRSRVGTSMAVSDSEDESSRRRHDRNLREQRRSQKITHQIDQLREVLAAASVRFKPDKYSTLVSVVEYVKQLQRRSTMLDMEHKKLLDTITRTNEIVNEPYLGNPSATASSTAVGTGAGADGSKPDPALSNSVGANNTGNGVATGNPGDIYNDDELVFVRNVDYKCIFDKCGMPLAVASIDGRLMDCNQEFVKLTGYRRDELLPNEPQQQRQQQQGAAITADESFSPNSIFPDGPTSSNSNAKSDASSATHSNNPEIRNFSLFNLLSRDNMEQVFVSLSEMLKQPPKEENGTNMVSNADYWSGNVRLSRNTHIEMRINVSLVRSPQGRAKFFDCSLTPLTTPLTTPPPPVG